MTKNICWFQTTITSIFLYAMPFIVNKPRTTRLKGFKLAQQLLPTYMHIYTPFQHSITKQDTTFIHIQDQLAVCVDSCGRVIYINYFPRSHPHLIFTSENIVLLFVSCFINIILTSPQMKPPLLLACLLCYYPPRE